MVLTKRIIPCLDVDHGRVVKGIRFVNPRGAGDPVELRRYYCEQGAEELVFLDITATPEKRDILKEPVQAVAADLTIPFTVGGGIRSVEDARIVLCSGADKVSINTAPVENPELITEIAEFFGRQCVVVAIDTKRRLDFKPDKTMIKTDQGQCWFEIHTYMGTGGRASGIDTLKWAMTVEKIGVGEILVTSIDKDGTEDGYDLDLIRSITDRVNIPVIASGGAGNPEHFLKAFTIGKTNAALTASVFHYRKYPVPIVKQFLAEKGVPIRL